MEIIPNHVLNDLIALGKLLESDNHKRSQLYTSLGPFDSCGRSHANAWIAATENLSGEQLSALVRGLVLAEESLPRWNGGSVSGVIWVFRTFQQKSPAKADELADWVLQHSTNDYVPFGVNRAGAKSNAEFDSYRKAKESRRVQSEQRSVAEHHCKKIRELVTKRQQQEANILQKAKGQTRVELIAELDNLTSKERLEHIAWDDEHDLSFYPDNYSEVTSEEFALLDEISGVRLILKLKQRHKGCWLEMLARITR